MPCNYKKYPANWKSEIRPAVLARAGNKCEQCGAVNGVTYWRGQVGGVKFYQTQHGQMFDANTGAPIGEDYIGSTDPKARLVTIVLTIAHLIYDEDKTKHCALHELKALCQRCHLLMDLDHHMRKRRETMLNRKKQINIFSEIKIEK